MLISLTISDKCHTKQTFLYLGLLIIIALSYIFYGLSTKLKKNKNHHKRQGKSTHFFEIANLTVKRIESQICYAKKNCDQSSLKVI